MVSPVFGTMVKAFYNDSRFKVQLASHYNLFTQKNAYKKGSFFVILILEFFLNFMLISEFSYFQIDISNLIKLDNILLH